MNATKKDLQRQINCTLEITENIHNRVYELISLLENRYGCVCGGTGTDNYIYDTLHDIESDIYSIRYYDYK